MTDRIKESRNGVGSGSVPRSAAEWVARLHADTLTSDDKIRFDEWMASDPAHEVEFRAHAAVWDGVGDLAGDPEARAMLLACSAASDTRRLRRPLIVTAFASAAAALVAFAFLYSPRAGLPTDVQIIATSKGEQEHMRLADGTRVILDTGTQLRVHLTDGQRWISVDKGQAFFEVASDSSRPFRVFAGQEEVRAIGTEFQVRRQGGEVEVVLTEGVVAIYRRPGDGTATLQNTPLAEMEEPAAVLRPGERATLVSASPVVVGHADITQAQAWRFGRIVLKEETLENAVAEINRYGGRRIVLGEPEIASMPVSGVFHTERPEGFVQAITAALPLRVARASETEIVLAAR